MFHYKSLVLAAAAVGLRVVEERPIPDYPGGWGHEEGRMWTMDHYFVKEVETVSHFEDLYRERCVQHVAELLGTQLPQRSSRRIQDGPAQQFGKCGPQ